MTIDDNTSRSGFKRFMMGREPVLSLQGKRLVDRHGRGSYVTSAGSGPSVGRTILMSFLPPEQAKVGTRLAVEYFGERYPATVAVVGPTPLFDPQNTRVRSRPPSGDERPHLHQARPRHRRPDHPDP